MRSAALLAALALTRSCLALPQTQDGLSKRADGDTVSVSGVTADGVVGTRREINELATDTTAFNLYLLATHRYVNSDTSDVLSYFQISGIHGVPCTPYSGVQGDQDAMNQGGCGYCTHSTTLFPAWHRSYTALYEQGFYEQVQGVISDFASQPDQQNAFKQAASGLRVAYWDWAATGGDSVPSVLTQAQVNVPSPSGGSQTIDNPFYQYKFQILNEADTGGSPWINWQDTLRYPTSSSASSTSDVSTMKANIKSAFTSVQALTYNMLLNCAQWEEMADDSASTSSAGCSAGLESIHDQVHMNIGGNGHMGDLGHASFDPVFWLHHTNVDRLLSLWQVAQDRTWFAPGSSGVTTYTATANQQANGDYPLTPFYKDAGSQTFWTPDELEDWTQLHYTYPEFSNGVDTDKSSVISAINKLYGTQTISTPSSPSSTSSSVAAATSSSTISSAANMATPSSSAVVIANPSSSSSAASADISSPAQFSNSSATSTLAGPHATSSAGSHESLTPLPSNLPSLLTPSGREFDWACNIVGQRMGLGGSYIVYIFLGDVPSDSSTWGTAANLVGTHGFFASSSMTASSGWLVSGSVSLTAALVEKIGGGMLKGLDSSVVEPYLSAHLNWAVKKASGDVVPNSAVPGLEVTVVSAKVTPAKGADVAPVFGTPQTHGNVTSGATGGYSGSTYGSGSSSGSGYSNGNSGSSGQGMCVPQVKYVYEYVYV
jgi:tyrosinase